MERPVNWVKPRIRIPDSTTTADSGKEVADVDIETVTSSDSDKPEDGWLDPRVRTLDGTPVSIGYIYI